MKVEKKISVAIATAIQLFVLESKADSALYIPTTSSSAYVTSTNANWSVTPLVTVGDNVGGYKMVGIPDGLGAFDNGDNTFTLLMNHELGATAGVARAHGSTGAFVSAWVLDKSTLQVLSGRDFVQNANDINTWNGTGWSQGTTALGRLCSADLANKSAFYNSTSGLGYNGQILMTGEEVGVNGRAVNFIATGSEAGKMYETPSLGKFSRENSLANPFTGDKTVVMGTDDTSPGKLYLYVGDKQATGNAVEKAGLANGQLMGIKVAGVATETAALNGSFTLENVNSNQTGAALNTEANGKLVTNFARPEDGHWADADTFYFVTTGNATGGTSKLYKLDFSDKDNLALGGTITMVKDSSTLVGTDGANGRSFDNITVAADGRLIVQEDPGNNAYIAKTWIFDPVSQLWTQILESDRTRFLTGGANYLTLDEENSGVISLAGILGRDIFLGVSQAHYSIPGELVEGGQLYAFYENTAVSAVPLPSSLMMLSSFLALGSIARRRI